MKGKVFLILFALPFFGVGVWMLISISGHMFDAWQMQSWEPVQAQLDNAGYETFSGDDSNTYEAFAAYTYRYRGQEYANDRVGIAGGADNIGDYQLDVGRRLSTAWSRGEQIEVYLNPDDPKDSVIDRDLRWGLIGFKAIFLLIFGGVGLGLIVFLLRPPGPVDATDATDAIYSEQPWLLNDKWQTPTIRSGSKSSMYFTWGFAAFWNLVSAPLPFVMYREIVEKENYAALFALLFPLVGIGLIVWAVRRTLEWRRFGAAPVVLDPFPGAIGGDVGGVIDVGLPYVAGTAFHLTLTSIYSYMSGSGDSRSRKETAKWQDSLVAHAEPGKFGIRLTFRFNVPGELPESDAEQNGSDYHLWRMNVQAALPGVDFDRDYEIPVYATGEASLKLSTYNMRSAHDEQDRLDDLAVSQKTQRSFGSGGIELFYPAGRNRLSALIGITAGGIFGSAGWFLVFSEGHTIFGSVFGGVASFIVLASLYSVFNSLQVTMEAGYLKTVRRVLGIPVRKRKIRRHDFIRFSSRSSSQTRTGSKHVMYYTIHAEDNRGQKIVVGEGFTGAGEASAAIRMLANELGLQSRGDPSADLSIDEFDVLAADR